MTTLERAIRKLARMQEPRCVSRPPRVEREMLLRVRRQQEKVERLEARAEHTVETNRRTLGRLA